MQAHIWVDPSHSTSTAISSRVDLIFLPPMAGMQSHDPNEQVMKHTGVPAEQQKLFSEGLQSNKGLCCVCDSFFLPEKSTLLKVWDKRKLLLFFLGVGRLFLKASTPPNSAWNEMLRAIDFRMVMHRHCSIPNIFYVLTQPMGNFQTFGDYILNRRNKV